jgi:hypothetical protein
VRGCLDAFYDVEHGILVDVEQTSDLAVRVPPSYQRQNPRCHSVSLNSLSASATELNSSGSRRSDPRADTVA